MSGEVALTFLLQQVTEVLRDYKDLKTGAGYEFGQLKNELLVLKASLKDSAKKSEKNNVDKEKESRIRELVYDVEDTIETYLAKMAAAKNKNIISRFFKKFSTDMAQQVKVLRQRVRPIVDEIEKEFPTTEAGDGSSTSLGKRQIEVKRVQSMGQPSVSFIHAPSTGHQFITTTQDQSIEQPSSSNELSNKPDKVVDFEDEAIIKEYLKEQKDELDVISITGMAGLGKTTLARKIFQDEEISRKFPLRIWIHVSQKFKSREMLLNILERFSTLGTSKPSEEELIPTVRGCLSKEEFLLVVDDVWAVQDWDVIEKILPTNNGKAKVLVTSRRLDVAKQVNVYRTPLHLSPLGSEKSFELLKLKVFGNAKVWPQELEDLGQAIANKCCGVPLTIVVIGGVLKLQLTNAQSFPRLKDKWFDVLTNVNTILQEDKEKSISKVLELSYNILPSDLRVCFLYTGLFPENHEIPASTLTQLWIAEGFIPQEDGQSIEENAEKYLEALINMNLLTATKKDLDHVKTCGVHDLVREFCKVQAKEQNLFRVIMKSKGGEIEPSVSEEPKPRRLCLHSDPSKFLSENSKESHVRSILCFFNEPFDLDPTHIFIPDAFNLLRILNCESIKFRQFPEVTRLILLKHISLSIDNLNVLPEQISKLVNLQTLIVETKSHSIAVKANIWKMIQLRRLKTKASISLDEKKWKGRAPGKLQAISRLSPESCKEALSKRAPNLKTLGIKGEVAKLFDTFSLKEFRHLEKLKVVNYLDGKLASDNPLRGLPQRDHFPPNLKRLSLSNTYLDWDRHMPILAQIYTLKVLKLKDNAFTGVIWRVADEGSGFRELQFLLIENSELIMWEASTTHFRSLTWLVLKKCKQLDKIPESLAKNLEKLEIECVKKSAAESARRIESARGIESIKKMAEKSQEVILGGFKLIVGPECDL